HIRPVLLDRRTQLLAVEHREDLERVGELHRRGVGVAVAGDHPAAETLGGDGELAAELARAEQHQGCKIHAARDSWVANARLDRDATGARRGGTRCVYCWRHWCCPLRRR